MQLIKSQTSFLVKRLQVANLLCATVVSRSLGLTLQCKRYQLSKVDIVLDQVIQNFDSTVVHAKPESHEQVELEASKPLVFPL